LKVKITNTNEPNPADINDKTRIFNITVLDLAPDWQIQQVLPAGAGAFEILQPGKSVELPMEAYLPDGYAESTDILKVFATQRTSGFRCLELPALDQPTATRGPRSPSEDPFEALLEAFTDPEAPTPDELRSRSIRLLERKEDRAWTVAQVEVRLHNDQACARIGSHMGTLFMTGASCARRIEKSPPVCKPIIVLDRAESILERVVLKSCSSESATSF
jgi:hypothetical protein